MWLLRLYPRTWRKRYGEEMAELLRNESWSPSLVIDIIAGAIDARLNPQLAASAAQNERGKEHETMFAKVLQLRCVGYGPNVTAREKWLSIAVMLSSMVVLTAIWMWVAITYREPHVRQYVLAFSQVPFFAGLILAMPMTILKGRSGATKAILMGVSLIVLIAWCALVGFVATTF